MNIEFVTLFFLFTLVSDSVLIDKRASCRTD